MTSQSTSARAARGAILLLLLALLALTAPLTARADVRFGPALASTASDPASDAFTPAVAGNAAGVVVAAYSQHDASVDHLHARVKPLGDAAFGAAQPLGGNSAGSPAAAVAADGTVTVAWQQANSCAGSSVWIATAPPGASFGAAVKVSDNAFEPRLAVGTDGTIMMVYTRDIGSCAQEVRVQIRPRTGSPTDAPISDPVYGSAGTPDIAIDDNGTAYAAFPQSLSASPFTRMLRVARRPAGGSWTGTTLSASQPDATALAVAPDGHAILADEMMVAGGWGIEIRSLAPGNSAFGPPQTVTDTTKNDPLGAVAISNGGAAAVTTDGRHMTVRAAGTTSFPIASAPVGVPVSASHLVPSFTAQGDLVLFDSEKPTVSSDYTVVARVQPPGGALGSMQSTGLTSTFTNDLALAPFGANDVIVGWEGKPQGATTFRTALAMGDGTAPALGGVSAPESGPAGTPLSFSANPTDDLGITDVRWSFGDGAAATDASTTHAFAAPGASTWSVSATDVAGNTASASGALTIQAKPAVVTPAGLSVHIKRPHRGTRARKLRRLRGTASGPVSRVEVAVVRVLHRRTTCSSLGLSGRLSKTACTARRFLKATGTTGWTLRLRHRLPAGRYVVFARARSATGAKSTVARITMTLRR